MKTVFVFREKNFKKVTHTNVSYKPEDSYVLNIGNEEIKTYIDKVVFKSNGTRVIYLKRVPTDNFFERTYSDFKILKEIEKASGINWVDDLFSIIEGNSGEVYWGKKNRKKNRRK